MKKVLHITSKSRLCKEGKYISIQKEDVENLISPENISMVVLDEKGIRITSNVLVYLAKCGVPILLMNERHNPEVFCFNLYSYYALTSNINKQISWKENKISKEITKSILIRKIKHQKELLDYFKLRSYEKEMQELISKLEIIDKIEDILIVEAQVAKFYFLSLFGKNFTRSEKDEINYALNYGYAVLRTFIKVQIINKGLHPSIGIFHNNQFNNYNLADDIIEVYRPIVDYVVKKLIQMDGTLEKNEKQKLLLVITQSVLFNGNEASLEYATNRYIDSIINSFTEEKLKIEIPCLKIGLYEY